MKRAQESMELPPCLEAAFNASRGRHYQQEHPNTDEKTKWKVIDDYQNAQRKHLETPPLIKELKNINRDNLDAWSSFTLLEGSFAKGKITANVLTDWGPTPTCSPQSFYKQSSKSTQR